MDTATQNLLFRLIFLGLRMLVSILSRQDRKEAALFCKEMFELADEAKEKKLL